MRRITLRTSGSTWSRPRLIVAPKQSSWDPEVGRYMERNLADHAMRNVRKAQAVLRLGQRYGSGGLRSGLRPSSEL